MQMRVLNVQRPTFPTGWTVILERLERGTSTLTVDMCYFLDGRNFIMACPLTSTVNLHSFRQNHLVNLHKPAAPIFSCFVAQSRSLSH